MDPLLTLRPILLIVDDDAEVLRALGFMAGTRGYDILSCATAAEAMSVVDGRVACLVVDQNLPDVQGIRLIQHIRSAGLRTPALLITTDPSAALRREAAAVGAPIVEKPLLDESLFQQIKRLVADAGCGDL
ncbi:MAG: response regulator [Brevundimonas sp.]|nr:response regulator [Brevundimonas sp.]MDO9587294.1 response regulator [Brevundimonas sp.]MDP3370488.1 response regulator [Brevundimonas sp.]MDP3658168.1 response regulator [Brevundimonas sp.]